jgi:PHP family Zn ribbon phosphoesterase
VQLLKNVGSDALVAPTSFVCYTNSGQPQGLPLRFGICVIRHPRSFLAPINIILHPTLKGINSMQKLFYDFHIHSCLSPCADNDMTPNNIVNMAKIKGLDIIALTDHNSCKNCEAVMLAGQNVGLAVLPGMELCTNEDIHVICLFSKLESALEFSSIIYSKLPMIKNNAEIFGEQLICDQNDNVTSKEENLLIIAADISVIDVLELVQKFGGACFPAHIDRSANGIIPILGGIPIEAGFKNVEVSESFDKDAMFKQYKFINDYNTLKNSDAHYLWQISEKDNCIELPNIFHKNDSNSNYIIINKLNWQ